MQKLLNQFSQNLVDRSPSIDSGTVTACPACGSTSRAWPELEATWPHQFCSARTTLAAN